MSNLTNDTFLTLKGASEGLYKEKGSKFIAWAGPTANLEAVKTQLEALRKQYHDARHHCYAYRLGPDAKQVRANDDGEPNHSAGDPILGQLRSHNLTNALVVVVRYFGGTKLGVAGLINAYRTAAAEAIAQNEIIERVVTAPLHLKLAYEAMNDVMRIVKQHQLGVLEQGYEATQCTMALEVRQSLVSAVRQQLGKINGVQVVKNEPG